MTPRRIVYVLQIFPKISETFIAGELAELHRRGIELRIVSLLPPRDEIQHDIVRRAGLDKLVEYDVTKFADVVKEFQPDLLHAHFAKNATEKARELAAQFDLPFTFTAHGYDIFRKAPPDFEERAAAARAVVTVSEANAAYISKTFRVPRPHIRVIPCGVDIERFCPAPGAPALPEIILCVARLVKVKNLGLLLAACAELRQRKMDFRCVIIGDGTERAELEAMRAQLGLETFVEMPGAAGQEDVLSLWQSATVGVLTSENEGMPISLMEAAACGVPVVATRVGGVPELVVDGETGLLTPPGNARGLADALERLLSDAALRERLGAAARRRAEERFSLKHQVDQLLALWTEILPASASLPSPALSPSDGEREKLRPARNFTVSDPFGAAADPALPTLAAALDPVKVNDAFKRGFPRLTATGIVKPKVVRVTRHKPGRRAVVEYNVRVEEGGRRQKLTLIGKVRARRYGNEGYRQLEEIWNAGFQADSADGISVPEPIGVIPEFRMWFQRKVPGQTATRLLAGPDGVALARRIAEAIHKLHHANVPTERAHTMADELRILRDCLTKVAALKPEWSQRVQNLQAACERLGASVPEPRACGVHRDFYPAQVIVDGARLYLIDFDLYCLGDPGLDVGNFLGHVTEESLRELGNPEALADVERAMEERFVELSGESVRAAVRAYTTLTLARHVYLSKQFPERQKFTEALLKLCEQRLGLV